MNVIKATNYEELSKKAALIIGSQMLLKPNSVMGFATGGTPVGTYAELVRMYKDGVLDFSGISTFNLDEYFGCPITDKNSYYSFMHENLFNHVNVNKSEVHLPNGMAVEAGAECDRYERAIEEAGGIDLQLLGIGHNGHIGFNEPADVFADKTTLVKLADSTIDANARFYSNRDEVPKSALSMGIGTIMKAKSILMLINGKDKKEIFEKSFRGPVTPQVPASILQYHPNCTVIVAVD